MNAALANAKRESDNAVVAFEANEQIAQQRAVYDAKALGVRKAIEANDHASLLEEYGHSSPKVPTATIAAAQKEVEDLGLKVDKAEQARGWHNARVAETDRKFRTAARDAIINGPRAAALDKLQAALLDLNAAAVELMGCDQAAYSQIRRFNPGAAAILLRAIDSALVRNGPASELRPSWLPWNGFSHNVNAIDGVAEAERTVLEWVAKEASYA